MNDWNTLRFRNDRRNFMDKNDTKHEIKQYVSLLVMYIDSCLHFQGKYFERYIRRYITGR